MIPRITWDRDGDTLEMNAKARCAVCKEQFDTAEERNEHIDNEHEL